VDSRLSDRVRKVAEREEAAHHSRIPSLPSSTPGALLARRSIRSPTCRISLRRSGKEKGDHRHKSRIQAFLP
jgi:hypothetical protein